MNSITITGNLTREPEMKFLNSGQATVKLGIAVNRRWQNRQTQEWEERVSYFTVIAYGKLAENCQESLMKGAKVTVAGRLEQRSWETETGEKRSVEEIVADDIAASLQSATVLISRNEKAQSGGSVSAKSSVPAFDDSPF